MEIRKNANDNFEIYGDYSPHPVEITPAALAALDMDAAAAFHWVKAARHNDRMPKPCGLVTLHDVEYTKINIECGERYWRYGTRYPSSNEYVRGYYHISPDGVYAVFSGGTQVKITHQHKPNPNPFSCVE